MMSAGDFLPRRSQARKLMLASFSFSRASIGKARWAEQALPISQIDRFVRNQFQCGQLALYGDFKRNLA